MGTQADMRNRHANIWVDNHARQSTVARARELAFLHRIPLSSNSLKGVLDKYSGVPTHVSHDTWYATWLILRPITLERLFGQAQPPRPRLSSTVRCQPTSWIWTRRLEGNIHPLDVDLACHWRKRGARTEQTVSTGACVWENNTPVHRKSLSDAQASCKGFQRSSPGKLPDLMV